MRAILFVVVLLGLVGCASTQVTEYNQGCRDGVADRAGRSFTSETELNNYCDLKDAQHRRSERMIEGRSRN
jgi:hypothetical protein